MGAPDNVGKGEGLGSIVGVGGSIVGVAVGGSGVGMSVATSKGVEVGNIEESGVGVEYSPHNPLEHPLEIRATMQKMMTTRKEFIRKSKELYR